MYIQNAPPAVNVAPNPASEKLPSNREKENIDIEINVNINSPNCFTVMIVVEVD